VAAAGGVEAEYRNWAWLDSRLTELGRQQASALRPALSKHAIDVVLVSPLSRAIATGLLGVPPGPAFVVCEELRERIGTHPCDKRRTRAELRADFPDVDVSTLASEQDDRWSETREPWEDVIARSVRFLSLVSSRPETHVAAVTHNDFLTALLFDSPLRLASDSLRIKFGNAEHLPLVLTWTAGGDVGADTGAASVPARGARGAGSAP
jgi:broad specificity phosphatase PhoE